MARVWVDPAVLAQLAALEQKLADAGLGDLAAQARRAGQVARRDPEAASRMLSELSAEVAALAPPVR